MAKSKTRSERKIKMDTTDILIITESAIDITRIVSFTILIIYITKLILKTIVHFRKTREAQDILVQCKCKNCENYKEKNDQ